MTTRFSPRRSSHVGNRPRNRRAAFLQRPPQRFRRLLVERLEDRRMLTDIAAHWIGGDGNWSDPANWDIGVVPNNSGSEIYAVVVDLPGSDPVITVDQAATVTSLTNSETLRFATGSSAITSQLDNSGTIQVTDPSAALTLSGTVTNSGIMTAFGGMLQFSAATVANAGRMITADGGLVEIGASTITGGTLIATDDPASCVRFTASGGTLDGVAVNGNLDLTAQSSHVTVVDGLALNGTATLGDFAWLGFSGTQALTGVGTVAFNSSWRNALWLTQSGTTLTIGSEITLRGGANYGSGISEIGGGWSNTTIINQGTIAGDAAGRRLQVNPEGTFINAGRLQASGGGSLWVGGLSGNLGTASVSDAGSSLSVSGTNWINDIARFAPNGTSLSFLGTWTNPSPITADGATVALGGAWTNSSAITATNSTLSLGDQSNLSTNAWSNAGTVSATDSTVNLGGLFAVASLGTINRTGGTVNLTGTLDNTGTTLALDATTGSWNLAGGKLKGGTLSEAGGTKLLFTASGGTLDGVTANSDLDLATNNNAKVQIINGLTLNATVRLGNAVGSTSGGLYFDGTQTLSGNGTVLFGKSMANFLDVSRAYPYLSDATLTIGPGITVRGSSGTLNGEFYSTVRSTIINQGTIAADDSGGDTGFAYDRGFSYSDTRATSTRIDTAGVTNAAPAEVYQTYRYSWSSYDDLSYTLSELTPGADYTVRLHFAEPLYTSPGKRRFHVNLNGTLVLSDFDIVAEAGAAYKAVVKEFDVTADSSGQVVVNLIPVTGAALVNGIEVLAGGSRVQSIDSGLLAGGTISIARTIFRNEGALWADNGGTLSLEGAWTNAAGGRITATDATLNLGGSSTNAWSNLGTITATDSTVNLGGLFKFVDLGTFQRSRSTVNLTGTLDNTGTTLALDETTGSWNLAGGTVKGGTYAATDEAGLVFTSNSGTLDGVTVDSDLDLATNHGARVRVVNGLMLNATVRLGNASGSTAGGLHFDGSQTLSGNGTILFGKTMANFLDVSGPDPYSSDATLTIGPGITVRGSSGRLYGEFSSTVGSTIINQGTIAADDSGGDTGFAGDRGFSFSDTGTTSTRIDTAGVTNAAPAEVYQTYRYSWNSYDDLSYTLSELTPGADYTVRLHFAEPLYTSPGERRFHVNLNGTLVLSDFDIVAEAGAAYKAVVKEFDVTADSEGQVLVNLTPVTGFGALVNGIEVLAEGSRVQSIDSGLLGGTITIAPNTFRNDGALRAENGGTLSLEGVWTNAAAGIITATGATLNLGGYSSNAWSNLGTITATDSTVNLGGLFKFVDLGTFQRSRSTVNLTGTLDNTGTTLALDATTGSWNVEGGTVKGGTYVASDGAGLVFTYNSGTLDGVTVNSDLDLATNSETYVYVVNGLTLNATARLGNAVGSTFGGLYFCGTQTLSGNGTVIFGKGDVGEFGDRNFLEAFGSGSDATLTIAPGITVRGSRGVLRRDFYSNDPFTIINQGTIQADDSGGLVGNFAYDMGFSPSYGWTGSTADVIDTSGVSDPAPQAVYQTWRSYPGFSYTLGSLTAGANYTVRLHFAEPSCSSAGERQFHVGINGTQVLTNFDIVAAAGGKDKAAVSEFTATADGSGQITVNFNSGAANNPLVNGIEVLSGGVAVQAINAGQLAGGTITIDPSTFTNQGSVSVNRMNAHDVTNQGTLAIISGGTINVGGTLRIDGLGAFFTDASASGAIAGSLLGTTTNADHFAPQGTMQFNGSGTASSPQLLEAMSQDLGGASAGFTRNFVYNSLALSNNTRVQLVDQSDNAAGAGAEAVYVDSLVVPTGTTLDLNGLHLYSRVAQVSGTIVGDTFTQIPDSGPITLGSATPGTIGVAGELDEWTFFGRAGRSVTVVVNPGGGGSPAPLPPYLGFAQLQLLDAADQVLATAEGNGDGQIVTLDDVVLPADGTYRLQIRASAAQSASTGNYLATVWEVTPHVAPITFNQPVTGRIETPYSVDHWTFSALAGQQIRFDLLNTSGAGIVFDLAGPNGWSGFSDLSGSSPLINLPSSGAYVLTAHGTGGGYDLAYACRLVETLQTDLTLGTTYQGTFVGSGQAQLFRVSVPNSMPLRVVLDDAAATNHNELYLKFGAPPTRGDYDYRFSAMAAPDQRVLVPMAASGTWYVLVYGDHVPTPSAYTLLATTADVFVETVTPDHLGDGADAILTVAGTGFDSTTTVSLVAADNSAYQANHIDLDSFTGMTATFTAGTVPPGLYSVRVARSDGTSSELTGAFQIVAGGTSHLTTNLVVPSALGRHATGTLYVEYTNDGQVAMPAPLLVLGSDDPDNSDRPILTLDQSRLSQGFWTSAMPEGFSNSVQFLADGATPGLLQPGESIRIPVYYAGLQTPWDFSDDRIEFRVGVLDASNNTPVDWASLKDGLRPDYIRSDAWDAVWANFTAAAGPTWGTYLAMLDANTSYLRRLDSAGSPMWLAVADALSLPAPSPGGGTSDLSVPLALAFRQADGLSPVRYLAQAVDAAVSAPGLPIVFGRAFAQPISRRFELGPLGRGWTENWQYSLGVGGDGTVTITDMTGTPRIFQPDSRPGRLYQGQPGDYGTLTAVSGGAFHLTESDGTLLAFRADGRLDYTQDTNGNRITCGYTGGLLTSLTHSSGPSLAIAYNPAGRIVSLTDPDGRQTIFTYDAANEHLLSVRDYDGKIISYSYSIGQGITREHALTQIAFPGGTHGYFTYDAQGRLASTYGDGDTGRFNFSYDAVGVVSAADALNHLTRFSFDNWGRIVKTQDALGRTVNFSFDNQGNLTQITDPAGRSYGYRYDAGNLVSATDALGNTTHFAYAGPFDHLSGVTDANGNLTRYAYDADGNLLSITYADGTRETWAYDTLGDPTGWTNRRGHPIRFAYNADGQVISKIYADDSRADYVYDSRGNLISTTHPTGTTAFTYDGNDYLTRIDYPGGQWLEFSYDGARRRAGSLDQLGHRLAHHYDVAGRLESITDETGTEIVRYAYDAAGRLVRKDLGNGVYTTYRYDVAGQLSHLVNFHADGSVLSRFDYVYDRRGRRTSMATLDGTWTYGYDDIGQLTHAVFVAMPGGSIPNQDLTYVYDALGNRIRTISNGVTVDYTTNAMNQYTRVGDTTYVFDADGNLLQEISSSGTTVYTYNDENRLIAVAKPSGNWQYTYDALGNRVASSENGVTTRYVIDPMGLGNVVGEYDAASSLIARYDYGYGLLTRQVPDDAPAYYTFDAIGSTSRLTNSSGAILNSYAYDPFGNSLAKFETSPNPFEFVGEFGVMNESSGLDFMRARFNGPSTGKFIQPDPLGIIGGLNSYSYSANNPVNAIDPAGLCYIDFGVSGGALLGVTAGVQVGTGGGWWYVGGGFMTPGFGGAVTGTRDNPTPGWSFQGQGAIGILGGLAGPAVSIGKPLGRVFDKHTQPTVQVGIGFGLGGSKATGIGGTWVYTGHIGRQPAKSAQSESFCGWSRKPPPKFTPPTTITTKGGGGGPTSGDPNAKTGPAGFGDLGYLTTDSVLSYRVEFENEPTATAPAQQVVITDQLDDDLDRKTFELTGIGFGDQVISVPAHSQHFAASVPMNYDGQDFVVQIEAGLNAVTGQVYAFFQTLDPLTGLPPGVLIGFLPPEDGTGRGKGYLTYVAFAKPALPTGTKIRNVALIFFDGQPAVATNQVDPHDPAKGTDVTKDCLNTIDAGLPTSQAGGVPPQTTSTSFTVSWSGSDDAGGSGIAGYDVYYREDDVDGLVDDQYQLWLPNTTATSAVFALGRAEHSYSFYTVATDNVGHREAAPVAADAQTQVVPPLFRLGVAGDSLSDEYAEASYTYAKNWVELLAQDVSVGAQGTWGAPRDAGFEYNWAQAGATSDTLLADGQHTGLAQQITAGLIDYGVLAIGQNDSGAWTQAYLGIYNGTWNAAQIDAYVGHVVGNIETALQTLTATGGKIVLSNVIDYGIAPLTRMFLPDPAKRELVTDVIRRVNGELLGLAQQYHVPLIDSFQATKDFLGTNQAPVATVTIGGVAFTNAAGTDPLNLFVDDGIHPHTVGQAVIANLVVEAIRLGYRQDVGTLSITEQEMLEQVGLGAQYTSNTLNLNYTQYIILPNDPFAWRNPRHWADVDDDGQITPADVLVLISDIDRLGIRSLRDPAQPPAPPFLDPSGDDQITPMDVLLTINDINANGIRAVSNAPPEGEGGRTLVSGNDLPPSGEIAGAEGEAAFLTTSRPWFVGPSGANATAIDSRLRFDSVRLVAEAGRLPMHNRLTTGKPSADATRVFLARRGERAAQADANADALFAGDAGFLELDDALADIAPVINAAWRARS
ncbi:MAG: malectin domain-containing carbohydrate-binding protein [Planctomycetota bacterium]|nr:malectin domain-containing carbohydrate-binding protein [Planctomycetota bacterium]